VDSFPRTYVPLRNVNWRLVLGAFAVLTTCLFFYRQLDYVANGEHRSALLTFSEEGVGALAGLAVFPLVYLVAIRFPLISPRWKRNLALHFAALCLISIVHTTLIALFRTIFFPLLGLHQGYGYMRWRYPMDFAHLFIFYWLGIGLIYLFHEIRFAREREIRQAKLEAGLAEAQLQNLRLQLEPHFLFNALNAISAAIYENPRTADEMIGRLSDLLRSLLKHDRAQEIPLAREVDLLKLYARIMEVRLEDRLQLAIEIDAAAKDALVPQMVLQPLVENAIRHGADPQTFRVDVSVRAQRENGNLRIVLRDHGPGIRDGQIESGGIGLRNTAERLERLYGNRQQFLIRNAEDGGASIEMQVPFSVAPA
jgi:two-component system, LytTR family, sensor kinase